MSRDSFGDGPNRQVLLRLSDTQARLLTAIAYLRGQTATEVVRTEVAKLLEAEGTSDRIQRIIRERLEYEAELDGMVSPIAPRRLSKPSS